MGLIQVRATALGFNGGPSTKTKSIWMYRGDKNLCIADEDRGLKTVGEVFMIEESKFAESWMERITPLEPQTVTAITKSNPVEVSVAPRKAGRPKKAV